MPNKMTFLMTFPRKIFDNVYMHHVFICTRILMLRLRLVDLNNYLNVAY